MPLLLAASEISRSCLAAGQIESAFGFLTWVKANAAEAALIALYVNFGPDGRAKLYRLHVVRPQAQALPASMVAQ